MLYHLPGFLMGFSNAKVKDGVQADKTRHAQGGMVTDKTLIISGMREHKHHYPFPRLEWSSNMILLEGEEILMHQSRQLKKFLSGLIIFHPQK